MTPVRILVFCVAFLASARTVANAATALPFTFVDNRMTVECQINGAGPFTMVVDTGSPDVVLDATAAQRLGLESHAAGTTTGAGNAAVRIGATQLRSLNIGTRSFKNVPASVLDLSQIRTKLGFPHLDGIIGYAIMKRFAVEVDPIAHTIQFLDTAPAIPASATITSFTGIIPVVPATLDGTAAKVIIDTGDRSSLTLFRPYAEQHKYYARDPSRENIITGYGIGGPVYGDVFSLRSLDIFGRRLSNVVTRASRQTSGVFAGSVQAGSVGEGVLKKFNVVYDYRKRRILAWPNASFAEPDRFVAPGATMQPMGSLSSR